MTRKELAGVVTELLKKEYPEVKCTLEYSQPHEMLFATQMSAQCTDARVNIVTKDLFKKYKTVEDFANADYDELCEDIRSTGFYRNKAKNIISAARRMLDVYNGEVPDTMEDLLTLPGTGRKTANLVLGDIYKKPAIVADTHCIRICGRLGFYSEELKDPYKVELILSELCEAQKQSELCHRLVFFGRDICSARAPKCAECPLCALCDRYKRSMK